MLHRGAEGVDALAGEHRAHRLDRARQHQRGPEADLAEGPPDPEDPGLDVASVLRGLQQERVGAALEQAERLDLVVVAQLVEGDPAGDADCLGRRPHRAGDKARPIELGRDLAGQPRRGAADLVGLVLQAILAQHQRSAAERVGADDVRPRLVIGAVHALDDVGAGHHQVLVAPLQLGAAEVIGGQVAALEVGALGAVENEDLLAKELLERLSPLVQRQVGRRTRQ